MLNKSNKIYPTQEVHKEAAKVHISSTGIARASRVLTNDDLSKIVDTSDAWISSRSGIKSRYIVGDETATDLAYEAAKDALKNANLSPEDIGLIIVATFTADSKMPSIACRIQAQLGIPNAAAFDLTAACSGFVYGLNTAEALMSAGFAKHCLLVGVEVLSKVLDWTDRSTCVLFGDGAGAVVLSSNEAGETAGIHSMVWGAQGEAGTEIDDMLLGLRNEADAFMRMQGRPVYKFAVGVVPELVDTLLDIADLAADEVDWVVAHQANQRILDASAQRTGIPHTRWFQNLEDFGNTSAASIAIALAEMNEKHLLQSGQKIFLAGFGGGLTYGAVYLTWK